jgi:Cys-tRNA(Pro)/Cys-tRNA(Cys) deacylase
VSTRAIAFLKEKQIPFEVKRYDHREKGALFAAEILELPPERVIKTLVVALGNDDYVLVLMPGDKELNLKRLAKSRGFKRAAMADVKTAERITGYQVGGISPFATRRPIKVIMDRDLLQHQSIAVNGGGRGVMLIMSPSRLLEVLAGQAEDLG